MRVLWTSKNNLRKKNIFHIKSAFFCACLPSLNLVENLPAIAMAQVEYLGHINTYVLLETI